MADISSIKLNDITYNIKDNNAVSKSDIIDIAHGGTSASTVVNARHALGVQAVQQVQASGGVAYKLTGDGVNGFIFTVMHGAASLNCICLVDIWDNIKYIGSFPSWLIIVKNTNDNSVIIQRAATNTASCIITAIGATIEEVAYDANRVTTNISPIVIPVEQGGTNATTAAMARENLGVVSKSGDTMSGRLAFKTDVDFTEPTPSSDQYTDSIRIKDKNGTELGQVNFGRMSDGKTMAMLTALSANGASNFIKVLIADGAQLGQANVNSYQVCDPYAFRNAIGAKNSVWPVSVGGTGGADSGIVNCTLSSGFTGTFTVRSLGKIVFFNCRLKVTAGMTAKKTINLGTIPSGYRPKENITIIAGDRDRWGSIVLYATGAVTFYNANVAINANGDLYSSAMYFTA